jgi:hypothetical protein
VNVNHIESVTGCLSELAGPDGLWAAAVEKGAVEGKLHFQCLAAAPFSNAGHVTRRIKAWAASIGAFYKVRARVRTRARRVTPRGTRGSARRTRLRASRRAAARATRTCTEIALACGCSAYRRKPCARVRYSINQSINQSQTQVPGTA